jgi:hypothetical protein
MTFRMPDSFYDPPEPEFEHDDDCESIDVDVTNLGEAKRSFAQTQCWCEDRWLEKLENQRPEVFGG